MRSLLLIFLFATSSFAADSSGTGINPFVVSALDDEISLPFFTNPGDDTLYCRLSWKEIEGSTSSMSFGTGVPPGQPFAYYWDDSAKISWFADSLFLQKLDLSNSKAGSTKTDTSHTAGFKDQTDIPEQMASLIQTLLLKE